MVWIEARRMFRSRTKSCRDLVEAGGSRTDRIAGRFGGLAEKVAVVLWKRRDL